MTAGRGAEFARLDRAVGRTIFGQDAAGYDAARADYPAEIYQRLAERCLSLGGSHVFEIGPGTGIVTRTLLAAGIGALTAFEPDPLLADHLRENLVDDRLRVAPIPFEANDLRGGLFDIGVAAASFHWLDAAPALAEVRRLLRPGGQWTMWWNVYRTNSLVHPLAQALQPIFADVPQPPSEAVMGHYSLDSALWLGELVAAGFTETEYRLVHREQALSAQAARSLYASFSFVRNIAPADRERRLDRIADVVERQFAGAVANPILTTAYFATVPPIDRGAA